jgi:nucleotide-binding universal stress UspA family protein
MFRKVLLPTDFSRHADKLLEFIPDLQLLGMKELVLLHVINPMKAARWITVDEGIVEKARAEAAASLDRAVRHIRHAFGAEAASRLEIGIIYQEILRVSREEQASLILMGSHGHGYVKKALLGSVTQNVLRLTKTPLVIEKFRSRDENGKERLERLPERMFSRVLFPTDFSENSLRAFDILRSMKNAGIGKIIVAHVQDAGKFEYFSPERREAYDRTDRERLARLKRKLDFWGFTGETVLREGWPFREINRLAVETNASLILMGSHGRSAVKEAFTGTVTESVALHHVRPLMIIPRDWAGDA